ncbi:MAG: hypothetical protein ABSH30_02625 [Acidimicrobiales bacterium]|jgi:hypothetical protein
MPESDTDFTALANRCWRVFEPVHATTYFAEESRTAAEAVGLKGWWMGYFAFRSAPLGPVPANVVLATFYNFHRSRVERAIPDAWALASIDSLLDARASAVAKALRRAAGEEADEVAAAALPLAERAAEACECVGRPLAAANQVVRLPEDRLAALWQRLAVLREHRGDGHIACLTTADLDGCEALVLHAASGVVPAEVLRVSRNWSEAEWAAAELRLEDRGLLAGGVATAAGADLRNGIEADTNRLAAQPYIEIGAEDTSKLIELLRPLSRAVVASGGFPRVNPIGLDAFE